MVTNKPTLVYITTIPFTLRLFLQDQMQFMLEKGFRVIGVSSPGPDLDKVAQDLKIEVFGITLNRGISPFQDLLSLLRLYTLFRKIRPTIVHGATAKAGLLSMSAAAAAGCPVRVYTLRGVMTEIGSGPVNRILALMEWIACKCAHRVTAVSESVVRAVVSQGLCPLEKIIIPAYGSSHGVDATGMFDPNDELCSDRSNSFRAKYTIPQGCLVIGFVGRLVKDKGIEELAAAWRILKNRYKDIYLLLVGGREPEDLFSEAVWEKLKIDRRVIITGETPHADIPAHYKLMDVTVLPTYREGFPNVALESAAMEIPIVATRVTGCVDAVKDGVTGFLVPVRDPAALAEAISRYLDDPELRKKHGQAGRKMVLNDFRPETIWQAQYEDYINLMKKLDAR